MTTRLDRILNLLATGSNASVKATAARQLGSIAASASRKGDEGWIEVVQLLTRIIPFLHHKQLETRVAAGKAVEAVCSDCGLWSREEDVKPDLDDVTSALDAFDLAGLLSSAQTLLASSGTEYKDLGQQAGTSSKKDVLSNLGLAGFGDDAFLDDELGTELDAKSPLKATKETPLSPVPMESEPDTKNLSARERNALKRKRKNDTKAPSTKPRLAEPTSNSPAASPSTSSEPIVVGPKQATKVDANISRPELDLYLPIPGYWPFHKICAYLSSELLNPAWEVRHGSVHGLLGILKTQGAQAGYTADSQGSKSSWMQDMTAQVLRVLCMDRFGDYVGDSVVAPVREMAFALLAACIKNLEGDGPKKVLRVLMEMIRQETKQAYVWQVRHAGLIGLKYLVAVKEEAVRSPDVFSNIIAVAVIGLKDMDDDVRAAAAATLIPLAPAIIEALPIQLGEILQILWSSLSDLKDDLSHSVGGIMGLLTSLLSNSSVSSQLVPSLPNISPLLFPYLRHTISSVRLKVLDTLQIFLSLDTAWIDARLLCLLFQNILLEEKADIRAASVKAFETAVNAVARESLLPLVIDWLNIALTPIGTPFNNSLFLTPGGIFTAGGNPDKAVMQQDLSLISEERLTQGRLAAAKCLAQVGILLPDEHRDITLTQHLATGLTTSPSAFQRFMIAIIMEEWALLAPQPTALSGVVGSICEKLPSLIEAQPPAEYIELAPMLASLQADCQALYAGMTNIAPKLHSQMPNHAEVYSPTGFTVAIATACIGPAFPRLVQAIMDGAKRKTKQLLTDFIPRLEEKKNKIVIGIQMYNSLKEKWDLQLYASMGCALIAFRKVPNKLNALIKSIMNSIKFESNLDLQTRSARSLASFIDICSSPDSTARVNPSEKLIKNLCTFLCQEQALTPIFTEVKDSVVAIRSAPDPTAEPSTSAKAAKKPVVTESEDSLRNKGTRRGAEIALAKLCAQFGPTVLDRLPWLWTCMTEALTACFTQDLDSLQMSDQQGQGVLDNLSVLACVAPQLDEQLHAKIEALFPLLDKAVRSPQAVIRQSAAVCITELCDSMPVEGLRQVVLQMLPFMSDPLKQDYRRGLIELVYCLVNKLHVKILPYVVFLVVPVLGRTTDADEAVRALATTTFASLIRLVPLEAGLPDPPGFAEDILARRNEERQFLVQLIDGSKIDDYELSVPIKAELRKYQKEGISWMAFLAKFQLHGILCDDMGLGKTLQTICILASQTSDRAKAYQRTQAPEFVHLPSLVICPPTLTGHWIHEIKTYSDTLRPALYSGSKEERARVLSSTSKIDVLVMSYDVARNDIANIQKCQFNYCVLDEGHVIKNGKTKLSQALKTIQAKHRLILSGTPIQNNLLELWSLFDFLMPGFLGTSKSFNERYSKPVQASREAKSSSKAQEAGTLALDALHKQVLPFLLRRLKEDVLDDLPPKIIQDYHCDLSPLQAALYEDHSASTNGAEDENNQHVFQSLQYLRKLVNHPLLVVKPDQASHQAILAKFKSADPSFGLQNVLHAPKLVALKQILQDCGIGKVEDNQDETFAPHRVLVFCQMRQMLDIIENDLFRQLMPSVTYMRMDGATPTNKRHALVQTFNADPSIDVLLMTTQVGGLGLNLTGADTVIFVEHDWNPMKDLQAMDRAHRLGQKRVVNVYRLITRGTLEEKIMGLQRFKLNIASSVVNQQNSSLTSMETDQVLDLFDVTSSGSKPQQAGKEKKISQKELLEGLGELEEEDYGFQDVS